MSINTRSVGGVATLEIARPAKKNALTEAMYEAMAEAVSAAVADEAVRALLITGQPGVFTAGNDLEDFLQRPPTNTDAPVFRFMRALATCDKPVVAAVTGAAVGIGTTMLLHCDYVAVATDARLSTPFVGLGLVPEAASSLLAPRMMGQRRAFELLVMGHVFDAAAAKECGIANIVVAPEDVDAAGLKAAREIAALPPGAVAAARALMRGSGDELEARIALEGKHFNERLQSPEAKAAFEAFFSRKR